jgi:ABC-type polysaccharide/polyol phosphate transport system ATPase subunit
MKVATVILENVNAHFPIYGSQQRSLREALFQRATGGSIEREGKNSERLVVKALTDISLTLHDGDRLGLIGHNGAGKSTLLKLIAGIYEPVSGTVKVEGRITPLFDAMPGLDSEDTGYENIITSGMLIGMTRQQIEAKIPEIEEFCELGEYLNLPVRTYSTGMTMRLGFALVTALDPSVLLMDEGFGTGDLRFAERARARMQDFIGRSRIMVLASHSDKTIRSMCNKALLIEAGRAVAFGPVDDVCDQYYASVHMSGIQSKRLDPSEGQIRDVGLADRLARTSGSARFTRAVARDTTATTRWRYSPGESVVIHFEYELLKPVPDLSICFRLLKDTQIITEIHHVISSLPLEAGYLGVVDISLPGLKFGRNHFVIYSYLGSIDDTDTYDLVDDNVNLPGLLIDGGSEPRLHRGVVCVDHEIKQYEVQESRKAG